MVDEYSPRITGMGTNRRLWPLMCGMAPLFSLFIPSFLAQYEATQRLMGPGASETMGRVIKVHQGDESDTSIYEFTVNGAVYTGRMSGLYNVGEAVAVRYLEDAPDQHAPAGTNPQYHLAKSVLCLGAILLMPLLAVSTAFRSRSEALDQLVLFFVLGFGPAATLFAMTLARGYSTGAHSQLVYEYRSELLVLLFALACSAVFLVMRRVQLPWSGRFKNTASTDIEGSTG